MAYKNWQTSDQAHQEQKTQINKIRNQRGEITTQTGEIQRNRKRITMINTMNLEEKDNFLETYNPLKARRNR